MSANMINYSTQKTSNKRVKHNKLGEKDLLELYSFQNKPVDVLREKAIEIVQRGSGKQSKKDTIIYKMNNSISHATIMKKAQDYILAGMGLGI